MHSSEASPSLVHADGAVCRPSFVRNHKDMPALLLVTQHFQID